MVFKKCREVDEVLFVDASTCFAKGKNQNVLTSDHVYRIVGAFAARVEEYRFSRRVPRDEIAANGYNLNIPRYVDTYVAPMEIDLGAIVQDLRRIETDMAAVDEEIRKFCAELGLESPA